MIRARASKVNTQKWYNSTSLLLNNVLPSLYHDYSKQRYFDTASGEYSFPFTGTRTSNATQFSVDGNLIWAPAQMCTRGQDLSTGWSMGSDGSATLSGNTAPTGGPSYNITWTTPTPSAGNAVTNQPAVVGGNMTLSVYLRYVNHQWARVYLYSNTNSSNGVLAYVDLLNKTIGVNGAIGTGTSYIGGYVADVGNNWVRVVIMGNANLVNSTDGGVVIASATGNNNATRVGNGATIEAASVILEPYDSSKPSNWRPEFNTTGSAWYGPRFDYNPVTRQPLGLLVETSRTNDIARSIRLSPSNLTTNGASVSVGPQILGGWETVRITGDGVSTWHGAFPGSVTPTASQVRTVSAVVSYVDTQFVQLYTSANYPLDSVNTFINVDMINGTITRVGSSASNAFIRQIGIGIYHIGFTFTCSAAPTGGTGAIVGLALTGTSVRQETNTLTTSVDVMYYANYAGTGYTSIIPSFTAATTRATDVINTSTGSWLNTSKGTIYGELTRIGSNAVSTITNIGDSGGSSERNQFRINGSSASHIVTVAGVVQSTSAASISPVTTLFIKGAYRYIAGTQMMSVNGVNSGAAGNIASLPGTQNTLHVGQINSAGEKADGWIKEIRYYADSSATNAQLSTLTT